MNQSKFVAQVSSTYDVEKFNVWFRECRKKQKPYITVTHRTKFSDVHWDYISYDKVADRVLSENSEAITQKALIIFHQVASDQSSYSINCNVITFTNIPIEKAELAATYLFDLIESIITTPPRGLRHD